MTQAQLAERMRRHGAQVDPTMIAKIEKGVRPTNVAEIVAIRGALGLESAAQLIDRDLTDAEALQLQSHRNWSDLLARWDDLRREQEQLRREAATLRAREAQLKERGIEVVEHQATTEW